MPSENPNPPPQEPADGALDELIRGALAADVDRQRVERLEWFWREQSPRRVWRRRTLRLVPLAAAASLLIVAWFLSVNDAERNDPRAAEDPPPVAVVPDTAPTTEPRVSPAEPEAATPKLAGRPPTEYERLLFITQTRARVALPTASADELLDRVVERLAAAGPSDAEQIIGEALSSGRSALSLADLESRLLDELSSSSGENRGPFFRALAAHGTERSVPALLELALDRTVGDEALATIEQIVGVDRWVEAARQTPDKRLHRLIAKRLVTADSPPALLAFLSLVGDEDLRSDAIEAALEVPELPVAQLIELLDHQQEPVRLAAAVALGRINRCEMTEALIDRVNNRPSRSKEAWLALLTCRCDAADRFLARAGQDPRLLGQLNNARLRWVGVIQ